MITIGTTYELITDESASEGESEEQGWEVEKANWQPGMLREFLDEFRYYFIEPSSSYVDKHTWWTAYDVNEGTREFYEDGIYKNLSLHINGATDATMRRIDNLLRRNHA